MKKNKKTLWSSFLRLNPKCSHCDSMLPCLNIFNLLEPLWEVCDKKAPWDCAATSLSLVSGTDYEKYLNSLCAHTPEWKSCILCCSTTFSFQSGALIKTRLVAWFLFKRSMLFCVFMKEKCPQISNQQFQYGSAWYTESTIDNVKIFKKSCIARLVEGVEFNTALWRKLFHWRARQYC